MGFGNFVLGGLEFWRDFKELFTIGMLHSTLNLHDCNTGNENDNLSTAPFQISRKFLPSFDSLIGLTWCHHLHRSCFCQPSCYLLGAIFIVFVWANVADLQPSSTAGTGTLSSPSATTSVWQIQITRGTDGPSRNK